MDGAPDAPAHDLMAYHAVRDLTIERTDAYANGGVTDTNPTAPGGNSNAITYAPRGLVDSAATIDCYRFLPTPADCIKPPADDDTLVPFVNPAGRNLPTYYLATGWPSLWSSACPTSSGRTGSPPPRSQRCSWRGRSAPP